ncbi:MULTISPECIES: hypothetical protein [Clostridia]|uniref:WxL domain-containing protein n=2 Tax=Clostridia TaxID=186801 RepID=A0A8I0AFT9_9CLOT|nr:MULTISPECIES: hypothetical protein [Clostridia]MBC5641208.1 hypothetical protein [Clostridium lentum]MBC5655397.1 hypothetical protein [Blautia lenta]
MKKKFLSLMMAAAVVATTSVSAFAAESNSNVTMPKEANIKETDDQTPTQDVYITGHVQDEQGEMPTASFKVTVPTAANFTVTNAGVVVGPELEVKNEGTQGIEVYATEFTKTTGGDLKVVKSTGLANAPRTSVALKLVVNGNDVAHLGAGGDENGVFKSGELTEKTPGGEKLLTLGAGANEAKTRKIKLEGTAGKGTTHVDKAVSDTFKLVLKIKKAPANSQ